MFEYIRKMVMPKQHLSKEEIIQKTRQMTTNLNTQQHDAESILVEKYLTQEQIKQLRVSKGYYSTIFIDYNEKKYVVGVSRSSYTLWYNNKYNLYLRITEVKKVPRNRMIYLHDLQNIEKCKFLLEKLPEVESSLNDISNSLNKEYNEIESRNECRKNCIAKLMEKCE